MRTTGWVRMTGTKEALIMTAHLEAWEGVSQIFTRDWRSEVPRAQI